MKDIILIIGSIVLGCFIFDLLVGDGESLKQVSGEKMEALLRLYQE